MTDTKDEESTVVQDGAGCDGELGSDEHARSASSAQRLDVSSTAVVERSGH
jgi:hypothetical protein